MLYGSVQGHTGTITATHTVDYVDYSTTCTYRYFELALLGKRFFFRVRVNHDVLNRFSVFPFSRHFFFSPFLWFYDVYVPVVYHERKRNNNLREQYDKLTANK